MVLEEPPPFQAFTAHTLPSGSEQPFSRLYDRRWIEVLTTHLKQLDAYLDTRKKLGGSQTGQPPRRPDGGNQEQAGSDKSGNGGKKGEGKKGKGKPAAEAAKEE